MIFLVCHSILKMKWLLVNLFKFLIRLKNDFSLRLQKGSLMKTILRSSEMNLGINSIIYRYGYYL